VAYFVVFFYFLWFLPVTGYLLVAGAYIRELNLIIVAFVRIIIAVALMHRNGQYVVLKIISNLGQMVKYIDRTETVLL
jgi:hypothetical protein